MASSKTLYYCALKNIESEEVEEKEENVIMEEEEDAPPHFQSAEQDLTRTLPSDLELPSVPEENPTPSKVLLEDGQREYPKAPQQIFIIPITQPNYASCAAHYTLPPYAQPPTYIQPPAYIQAPPYARSDSRQNQFLPYYAAVPAVSYNPNGIQYNSAPNDPIGPQSYLGNVHEEKGIKLFADIFSRADKNDDGGLTFEEFQNYFADNILSDNELLTVFDAIDKNNNGNIELLELVAYFRAGFGPFENLFTTLASVHESITDSLHASYDMYTHQDSFQQFRTRIYLKEAIRQMSSLSEPAQSALNTLELTSKRERDIVYDIRQDRIRSMEESTNGIGGEVAELRMQIEKLSSIVGQLHPHGNLNFVEQELFNVNDIQESTYILVSREFEIIPEMVLHFRDATRGYVESVKEEEGNLQIYIKQTPCESEFAVLEIWSDESFLQQHNLNESFRNFQKYAIDCLLAPVVVKKVEIPCSWWQ